MNVESGMSRRSFLLLTAPVARRGSKGRRHPLTYRVTCHGESAYSGLRIPQAVQTFMFTRLGPRNIEVVKLVRQIPIYFEVRILYSFSYGLHGRYALKSLAFLATSVSDLITNNDDTAKPAILMSDSCRGFTQVPCEPKSPIILPGAGDEYTCWRRIFCGPV